MPAPDPTAHECRRRSGRIRQESLISNLGEVVDLSKGGMRVRSAHLPAQGTHHVTFDGLALPWQLSAELLWSRLVDHEQYEAGFRFVSVTPEQSAWLTEVAMRYSLCRGIPEPSG